MRQEREEEGDIGELCDKKHITERRDKNKRNK